MFTFKSAATQTMRDLLTALFLFICFGVSAWFILLRVVQMRPAAVANESAEKNPAVSSTVHSRASILDCNGTLIVSNADSASLLFDKNVLCDRSVLAHRLGQQFNVNDTLMLCTLNGAFDSAGGQRFSLIKNNLAPDLAASLKEKATLGIEKAALVCQFNVRRDYPNGRALSHVLGYVSEDGQSMGGIEEWLDIDRAPRTRNSVKAVDDRRWSSGEYSVQLTIDLNLQQLVEEEIAKTAEQYDPELISCIMLRPESGEILALANYPTFDPLRADFDSARPGAGFKLQHSNAAIERVFPSPIFTKPLLIGAVLSEQLGTPEASVLCNAGSVTIGSVHIFDHKARGAIQIKDILASSGHVALSKLVVELGPLRWYEYLRRAGIGDKTGVQLPNEITGSLLPPHTWASAQFVKSAFGEGIDSTPLQLGMFFCSIANGGNLMAPQIVKSVTNGDDTIYSFQPTITRRLFSTDTTRSLSGFLHSCTEGDGEAANASVDNYEVAGLSASSSNIDATDAEVYSFAGFAPAEKPEFVVIIVIQGRRGSPRSSGSELAAPLFARIVASALEKYHVGKEEFAEPETPTIPRHTPRGSEKGKLKRKK
jgi:cell division protein FtsI/penicillin-binding protein 2